ncbi:MAG: hypothetical protein AB7T49_14400 [Oligoflexales bacterium]
MHDSKDNRRKGMVGQVDVGEKRKADRRGDSQARQHIELLYENLYLLAFEKGKSVDTASIRKDLDGPNERYEEAEMFVVHTAIFDSRFGSKKSLQEFATGLVHNGLVVDDNGKSVSAGKMKNINWG